MTFDERTAPSIAMHVILTAREQDHPDHYPAWSPLGWFRNVRGMQGDVENHYHDIPEAWIWHEGSAFGIIAGAPVELTPGTAVYLPPGCLHSYAAHGRHSNTGIAPRRGAAMRAGHLHPEETGESPSPASAPVHLPPHENTAERPGELPQGSFLRNIYSGWFPAGAPIWRGTCAAWMALLIRTGGAEGIAGPHPFVLGEGDALIVQAGTDWQLAAGSDSDIAFAIGWPES
ncbi:MAG TPA: AraC family ligand binding domain-containing protein [Terrimicrobiaceae bacterium]|nr:AraC family ligand binding domain-containing protein [Terrimicrobiaceae bacterium]